MRSGGESITDALNAELASHRNRTLVNLASNEYWRAVDPDRLDARILDTRFLDTKNGNVKFISFFAKKARGLMAAYIAKNKVETIKALKAFDYEGYRYNEERSSTDELVYVRSERH